ncbi:MAG: hypothetical protein ACOCU1_02470 [Bacillota bacterium]
MDNEHTVYMPKPKDDDAKKHSVYHDLYRRKETRDLWEEKPNRLHKLPLNVFILFVSFAIPMIGFIIWILQREDHPKDARYSGIGTLIGFIVLVLFNGFRLYMAFN